MKIKQSTENGTIWMVDAPAYCSEPLKLGLESEGYEVQELAHQRLPKHTQHDLLLWVVDAKTTDPQNLLQRVKQLLRNKSRRSSHKHHETIAYKGLVVDLSSKTCSVNGNPVKLRKKELEILILLMRFRGRILSRETILSKVWSSGVVVLDRTIDVNITRLRRAIAPYDRHIVTRSGYGYGFEE